MYNQPVAARKYHAQVKMFMLYNIDATNEVFFCFDEAADENNSDVAFELGWLELSSFFLLL